MRDSNWLNRYTCVQGFYKSVANLAAVVDRDAARELLEEALRDLAAHETTEFPDGGKRAVDFTDRVCGIEKSA